MPNELGGDRRAGESPRHPLFPGGGVPRHDAQFQRADELPEEVMIGVDPDMPTSVP